MTGAQRRLDEIWRTEPGPGRLAAVNHSVLGIRFIVTALAFFAIGGALAMLIRAQLATSRSAFMEPGLYAQVFTMHGSIMMFLFAIPLFEGLAMYLLPKMLGARDLAFPRLSAYGYWCYLFGGAMLIVALVAGAAPDAGWFMYTPLSSKPWSPGINADVWLLGITFVEISAISAAVEIIVSVLLLRAPGMSLGRMPVFGWYMLAVAAMMLLGFPPLILGTILLEAERAFGLPFFDPLRGGDPLLWQHLFWFFGHPEVYIIFLPAAGAVSTILPVFAGRPLAGYRAVVLAVAAMAILSFALWVHHMYTTGLPHLSLAVFSAASAAIAIPTSVQIFAWIATLAGRKRPAPGPLSLPMLHILGFLFIFVIGGLTGVMLAIVPFNWQVHDTHFVVAHLHYVLVGGFLFPMMAALYHWLPLFTGRAAEGMLGRIAFWLIFLGFNAAFFVMHLTGLLGMPRRVHSYAPGLGWDLPNLVSSVGAFVMAAGFALLLVDVVLMLRHGRRSPPDPWGAATLEWATPVLPPPSYVFAALPRIDRRADTLEPQAVQGRYLAEPRADWMETLAVSPVEGEARSVVLLPARSLLPLWTALATGGVFLSMLAGLYGLAALSALAVLALALAWPPHPAARRDIGALDAGGGLSLPPHPETAAPPAVWAMRLTLAADATAFVTLLAGGVFLALSASGWPPPEPVRLALAPQALALAGLALALIAARAALVRGPQGRAALWLALAGNALAAAASPWLAPGGATAHAAAAMPLAAAVWLGLHAALGAVLAGNALRRIATGHVSARRRTDLRLLWLWQAWQTPAGLLALAFPHALAALG